MASFRKRNNMWQAQVRNKHVGSISKSFHIKSDAQRWAKEQQVLMQYRLRIPKPEFFLLLNNKFN